LYILEDMGDFYAWLLDAMIWSCFEYRSCIWVTHVWLSSS